MLPATFPSLVSAAAAVAVRAAREGTASEGPGGFLRPRVRRFGLTAVAPQGLLGGSVRREVSVQSRGPRPLGLRPAGQEAA